MIFLMQVKSRTKMVQTESTKKSYKHAFLIIPFVKSSATTNEGCLTTREDSYKKFSDKLNCNFNWKQETGNKTNQWNSSKERAQWKQPMHAKCIKFDFLSSTSRKKEKRQREEKSYLWRCSIGGRVCSTDTHFKFQLEPRTAFKTCFMRVPNICRHRKNINSSMMWIKFCFLDSALKFALC